jgi:O-antigen ligase
VRRDRAGRALPLGVAGAALAGGVLQALLPQAAGAAFLAVALLWGVGLVSHRLRLPDARFLLPAAVLLTFAILGSLTAFDRGAAWPKFWMLASGAVLFAALASQPEENLTSLAWFAAGLGGGVAALTSILTIMTRGDATALPTFGILSDAAGGLMTICMPFAAAMTWISLRQRRTMLVALSASIVILMLTELILTQDRSAWLAVIVGGAVALGLAYLARRMSWPPKVEGLNRHSTRWMVLGVAALAVGLLVTVAEGPAVLDRLARAGIAPDRLALYGNSLRLAGDFFFIGGGLGSFAGLYSRYILLVPVLFTPSSHNLYIDIGVELGAGGLIAFLLLMAASAWRLLRTCFVASEPGGTTPLLRWAALASLVGLLAMGLAEDPLYTNQGLFLLLAPAGLTLAFAHATGNSTHGAPSYAPSLLNRSLPALAVGLICLIAVTAFGYAARSALTSRILANLGSVFMARAELVGWPQSQTDPSASNEGLGVARHLLTSALLADPNNAAANYRLGLLALDARDFSGALPHLRSAWAASPDHRGIRKALAYDLTWLGRYADAKTLFAGIPEAPSELGVYAWWWGTQGRSDLAKQASLMETVLSP